VEPQALWGLLLYPLPTAPVPIPTVLLLAALLSVFLFLKEGAQGHALGEGAYLLFLPPRCQLSTGLGLAGGEAGGGAAAGLHCL